MNLSTENFPEISDKPEFACLSYYKEPLFLRSKKRIHGLDFLRGLCVLLMILDHASYDIMMLPWLCDNFHEINNPFLISLSEWIYNDWWGSSTRMVIRLTVVCIFFSLSGICSTFSRNNLIRSIKLLLAAGILSAATNLAFNLFALDIEIVFGVVHCFAVSVLIFAALEFLLKDNSKYACLAFGLLIFAWGLLIDFSNIQYTHSLSGVHNLPDFLRVMIGTHYYGADCFGILPFAGIFLIGACGGKLLYKYRKPYAPVFEKIPFRPVCFVGRNALWFYLLHQVVVYVIIVTVGTILGLHF